MVVEFGCEGREMFRIRLHMSVGINFGQGLMAHPWYAREMLPILSRVAESRGGLVVFRCAEVGE